LPAKGPATVDREPKPDQPGVRIGGRLGAVVEGVKVGTVIVTVLVLV